MKAVFPLFVLLAVPSMAGAAEPMSAAAFDAYTQGKTFYYAEEGQAYGGEEYLENRRVRWSFLGGECKDGKWYEDQDYICFIYEDGGPQCWQFFLGAQGLVAKFKGPEGSTELYEVQRSDKPLNCLAPNLGV